MWRKWLLWGTAPLIGLVIVIGVWSMLSRSDEPEEADPAVAEQPDDPEPEAPKPPVSQTTAVVAPPQPPAPEVVPPEVTPTAPPIDPPPDPVPPAPADPSEPPPTDPPEPPADPTPDPPPAPDPILPNLNFDPPPPPADVPDPPPSEPPPSEPPPDVPSPVSPPSDVPKPVLPKIDVEARLADTIPQIQFQDVSLGAAVDFLAEMSTLPITFDPEAMSQLGVSLDDPITVELSQKTVAEVLQTAVAGRRMATVVEEGHVLITGTPSWQSELRRRRHPTADLIGSEPSAAAELAALTQKLVAPDTWQPGGGRGSIVPENGSLLISQTDALHQQVMAFCEKLRNARGKPLQSRAALERFDLATRPRRAAALLARPVTVNFHDPAPLARVIDYLEELTGGNILIDRKALAAAGWSAEAEVTLKAQKKPLAETLTEVLRPLGLGFRAVDAKTLQITTHEALAERLELEFYPAARLASGLTGQALVDWLRTRLAAPTWQSAGGKGVLHFDEPSGCLIVLQSQPVHVALERQLVKKAE